MTDRLIFDKALKKAKQNGFDFKDGGICWLQEKEPILKGWEYLKYKNLIMVGVDSTAQTFMGLNDIIFSHDFAKAFFGTGDEYGHYIATGTEGRCGYCGCPSGLSKDVKCWQYCLQRMVLEENPLKYMEKFL